ncbi:MAG: DNA-binding protein [Gammaproteobacteria bacterium]|nr:DNA-binding protein [Gammaproteobacteria bacterium]
MSRAKPPIHKKESKSQILAALVDATGMKKKDIQMLLVAVHEHALRHLGKNGSGEMSIPELGIKLRRVTKAATKAATVPNPFKPGEMVKRPARPASLAVRVAPLKVLKDAVAGRKPVKNAPAA